MTRSHTHGVSAAAALCCVLFSAGTAVAGEDVATTTMVSIGTGGILPECATIETHCYSVHPDITPDGRYAVYASVVQNLVSGPQTPTPIPQIMRHDRLTCTTVRVSETATGQPADKPCEFPSISEDGQVIAFRSRAANLAPGVPNLVDQVYVYDFATDAPVLISKSAAGVAGNASCGGPIISADARWVLFQSDASNLVPGDTNGQPDIFLYDRQTAALQRVNTNAAGEQANGATRRQHMSPSGRFITFDSTATNLVPSAPAVGPQAYLLDRDSDNNGIFDEPGGTSISLVSVNSAGEAANGLVFWPFVSDDGSLVAFWTTASNLVDGDTNGVGDIFVHNRATGITTRESVGPNGEQTSAASYFPMHFSADNRYLTFHSPAHELVEGGHNGATHIFRRDLLLGENIIISRNFEGDLADASSEVGVPSASGQTVIFTSAGYNMIPGGTSNPDWVNVYVRSLRPADLTGDGAVGVADLLLLLSAWGDSACSMADLNQDGAIGVADLLLLLADWGS